MNTAAAILDHLEQFSIEKGQDEISADVFGQSRLFFGACCCDKPWETYSKILQPDNKVSVCEPKL